MLQIRLHNDLARKCVNINAPFTENMDAMMSVEYSSIRSGFQTMLLPWSERTLQDISCKPSHLRELDGTKGAIRVERLQRRDRRVLNQGSFGTVDGLGSLLHHAPTRIVPQHQRGKEQGINSVKHASVTRQKRA
jgi:hypothetical protein